MQCAHDRLYDIDPQTGATIEVFYADRTLETFGRGRAGFAKRLPYRPVPYELLGVSARDGFGQGSKRSIARLKDGSGSARSAKRRRRASTLLPLQLRVEASRTSKWKSVYRLEGCWRARNDSNVRPPDS
jgi:hypothetical protein